MDKQTKIMLTSVVLFLAIVFGGFAAVKLYSDVDKMFTTVQSESMQHSGESSIGTIDTGDMIILKNKDKGFTTYIEGRQNGYTSFGEYGDVVVYSKDNGTGNPIIHRLFIYLEYTGSGWSAPSLENYPLDLWSCTSGTDTSNLSGVLTFRDIGYGNITVSINLDSLPTHSGYLTKGDNASTNTVFDQLSINNGLVQFDDIRSVAWIEIPWGGVIKMYMNGNLESINEKVPNTIPSMVIFFLMIIFVILALDALNMCRIMIKMEKK